MGVLALAMSSLKLQHRLGRDRRQVGTRSPRRNVGRSKETLLVLSENDGIIDELSEVGNVLQDRPEVPSDAAVGVAQKGKRKAALAGEGPEVPD